MLYGKNNRRKERFKLSNENFEKTLAKYKLPQDEMNAKKAYRLIKDELIDEGNARQNLATFTQTFMEDEAKQIMSETLEKNAIDKSEYPRTAEIENRCVNIIADLWNVSDEDDFMGTSTVGSSEACMLGGLSLKMNWYDNALKNSLDLNKQRPNLVISSGYQICWEKFCVYWDIEMRQIPIDNNNLSMNTDVVLDYVDEYTIGIVGILGITYTGKFDNISKLDELVEQYNKSTDFKISIHVDAASGGFFTPFINQDLLWDFRLKNVVSINSSGHKYGLVYPGIGWIIWRDRKYIPERLIFKVSYLGGELPTMAINFSRSASQIIGQYYNFIRFGFNGYQDIHQQTKDVALFIVKELKKTKLFKFYNEGDNIPIICYKMNVKKEWTLYDLADRLLMKGWQVPAYPLPSDLDDIIVQRIVCRADLSINMAEQLIEDFLDAISFLENKNHKLFHGFTH